MTSVRWLEEVIAETSAPSSANAADKGLKKSQMMFLIVICSALVKICFLAIWCYWPVQQDDDEEEFKSDDDADNA